MRPQTRIRKMRKPGRHAGPSQNTDGTRQVYYDPAIRAARRAARRQDANEQESTP